MLIKDIVIIGSGNLASSLAPALFKSGRNILSVYSRNILHAKKLADNVDAKYTDKIIELPRVADLYIIAVSDSAIPEIINKLDGFKGIVVHTSGFMPISVFPETTNNCGVFYPLMTFSKNSINKFNDIPICIEAKQSGIKIDLMRLAQSISKKVFDMASDKRKMLHLAAVFANNFTNLNYTIAADILKQNDLPFDLLKPLILQTSQNIMTDHPSDNQTGPAVREDEIVMRKQVEILSDMPEYKEIYELLSKLIISIKHKK